LQDKYIKNMSQELGKPKIDPSKIKQEYKELKQEADAQPTAEEIREQRAMQLKAMEEDIPFLKKLEEFKRLEISVKEADIRLVELDVAMGIRDPQSVPGLIGKKLQIDSMKTTSDWVHRSLEQVELQKKAMEEKAELEKLQKEAELTEANK